MSTNEQLIDFTEGLDFEVKAAQGAHGRGELPKDFWRTYASFANTNGGVVLLGLREPRPGHFEVVGLKEPERVRRELWALLGDRTKVSANLLTEEQVSVLTLEGKAVLAIQVPRAPRRQLPVFIHGNPLTGTYRRLHDGDHPCADYEVRRMMAEAAEHTRDTWALDGFGWNDIDLDTFRAYRNVFESRRVGHPFVTQDNQAFLQSLGGWGQGKERNTGCLTAAGLLMFGKWRSIIDEFPNYALDYRDLPADPQTVRYLDRLITDGLWSGNLFDFYRRVFLKLTEDLKVPFRLVGDARQDETPVHEAIREALANCLIHADYSGRLAVLVIKRPGVFAFRNPGRMRVSIEQAIRGGESDCRNRTLQNMFFLVGRGDRLGSGVPTIFQNWKGQHWRQPMIWEELEPEEQTLLRLNTESLLPEDALAAVERRFGTQFQNQDEIARLALVTVEVEGFLTHGRLCQLSERHPHDLSRLLAHLVQGGFLESDRRGRGTSYRFPGTGEVQSRDLAAGWPQGQSFRPSASSPLNPPPPDPSPTHLNPSLNPSSTHLATSSTHLASSSTHLTSPFPLPPEEDPALLALASPVRTRGKAKEELIRVTILELCQDRFLTLRQLAVLLGRTPANFRLRFLSPMVKAHQLEWRFPNNPSHEQQAYRTVAKP